MKSALVLPLAFVALLVGAWRVTPPAPAALIEAQAAIPPPQEGSFPGRWINGVNCGIEPSVQVHAYNEDLYIIRQSKCDIFEAPFLFLIFGEDKALLMDTGANPNIDVWSAVDRVVQQWLTAKGKDSIPLVVAHTHAHGDHIQGDSQFVGKPYVEQVVGLSFSAVTQFWGFQDYPNDVPTIDLGNRVIDVLGTPGHAGGSVTLYDHNTQLLLTGDIVYPGHLFVFSQADWPKFVASIERLVAWAAEHPVKWVVGCHIEMSDTPYGSYAWGASAHPTEHVLEFHPRKLDEIRRAALTMNGDPECTIFDEFVIHPVYKCGITWNG